MLQRAKLNGVRVIGALDVSLNTFQNQNHTWQLQLFLLVNTTSKAAKEALANAFTLEPAAKRPLHVSNVYMPRTALTYSLKSTFGVRSAFSHEGNSHIKKQPLQTKAHLRELSVFLAQGKPLQRLVLKGLKREGENLKVL